MKKVFLVCMMIFTCLLSFGQSQNPFDFALAFDTFFTSLTPIVAIIGAFGLPVFIVWIVYIYKRNKAEIQLMEKSIEAGKDVPEDYFKKRRNTERNLFGQAMSFISVGLGLAIIFWVLSDIRFASIGLLFILIGIGRLITYYVAKSETQISK
ncbi:DUF6249 domain-containing protein [Odoribacter sp. OttesenSCG-928-L07]|nr:DUF6249 domain-containing protein [Odoribacter sp. OttesenSCG-928-L07]MDL2239175.1 DUF6249 domain-containing protein [Bacteroidales bacterium OttesenSCG-928-L14]MDL2240519.1 DUF6249 domain-containing protein [Bacteroidales bacterium OttesenSCG-928-K22]